MRSTTCLAAVALFSGCLAGCAGDGYQVDPQLAAAFMNNYPKPTGPGIWSPYQAQYQPAPYDSYWRDRQQYERWQTWSQQDAQRAYWLNQATR